MDLTTQRTVMCCVTHILRNEVARSYLGFLLGTACAMTPAYGDDPGGPTLGPAASLAPARIATLGPLPQRCDPSYPSVCIPPPPPDLNCGDIPHRRFAVRSPDSHGFDNDRDGVGCER